LLSMSSAFDLALNSQRAKHATGAAKLVLTSVSGDRITIRQPRQVDIYIKRRTSIT